MNDAAWLSYVAPVLVALFGGGGIVGAISWRHQKRVGIRQEDRADDDAISKRAQDLLKAQFELLVKPLQDDVSRLREEVEEVRDKLNDQRTRYWRLVNFVRALRSWAIENAREDAGPHPQPPPDLMEDL